MRHVIALLVITATVFAADYDSNGQRLNSAQAAALDAETPARIKAAVDGNHRYKSKADSDAIHAAAAAYMAAKPTAAEVIEAQLAVSARTLQLLAAAHVQAAPGVNLRIGDLSLWTSLVVLVPATAYPYTVDAYTAAGVATTYALPSVTSLQVLLGQGAVLRGTITAECMALRAAQAAATSRTSLRAINDAR